MLNVHDRENVIIECLSILLSILQITLLPNPTRTHKFKRPPELHPNPNRHNYPAMARHHALLNATPNGHYYSFFFFKFDDDEGTAACSSATTGKGRV
jgi:hypothetical protein